MIDLWPEGRGKTYDEVSSRPNIFLGFLLRSYRPIGQSIEKRSGISDICRKGSDDMKSPDECLLCKLDSTNNV
jgi:hypothetical protein